MKKVVFAAVEGIPFAGKTTLTKALETEYQTIRRLRELSEFHDNGAKFPPFSTNPSECVQSDAWFFEQECIRTKDIPKIASDNLLIADRSYLSALAHCYSRDHTYNLGCFSLIKETIFSALNDSSLPEPYFIYLRIDLKAYTERKEAALAFRKKTFGVDTVENCCVHLHEDIFISHQIDYFDQFFSTNRPVLILNGNHSVGQNVKLVSNWLNTVVSNKHYEYTF